MPPKVPNRDIPIMSGEQSLSERGTSSNDIASLENIIADRLRLISDIDTQLKQTRSKGSQVASPYFA